MSVQQFAGTLQKSVSVFITLRSAASCTNTWTMWEASLHRGPQRNMSAVCVWTPCSCTLIAVVVIWIFSLATVTDSSQCCQLLAAAPAEPAHSISDVWRFSGFVQKTQSKQTWHFSLYNNIIASTEGTIIFSLTWWLKKCLKADIASKLRHKSE